MVSYNRIIPCLCEKKRGAMTTSYLINSYRNTLREEKSKNSEHPLSCVANIGDLTFLYMYFHSMSNLDVHCSCFLSPLRVEYSADECKSIQLGDKQVQ